MPKHALFGLLRILMVALIISPSAFAQMQPDETQNIPQGAPAGGGKQQPQVDCEQGVKQCAAEFEEARKACTTQDMQAGMNPMQQQQAQQLVNQGNQANQNVGQQGNNQAGQCQNQADLSKILSALSALKGTACMTSVSSCESTCEEVAKACQRKMQEEPQKAALHQARMNVAAKKIKACSGMSGNGAAAMAQAGAMMMNMFQNQQCAQQTSAGQASPTPLANDCSNQAYAQVTQACICAPVGANPFADPQNPICGNGQGKTGINPSLSQPLGPSTPPVPAAEEGSEGSIDPRPLAEIKPQSGNNTMEGGGGGGGNFGKPGGGDDGPAGSTIDKNVITGTSGSGGGGGMMGGGGGGGGGGLGNFGGAGGGGGEKLDLSQWLPKGKYKALNIGGMSIKPYDGITGPMGPSIWEKVSNQYQQQKPRLIPER